MSIRRPTRLRARLAGQDTDGRGRRGDVAAHEEVGALAPAGRLAGRVSYYGVEKVIEKSYLFLLPPTPAFTTR